MDPADASTPDIVYTDEEKAEMARGITAEQIAHRREYYATEAAKAAARAGRPPDTFWTPIHPRGIVTIPRSLPIVVRQLVSLVLLVLYPFWVLLVLCFFTPGIVLFAIVWVLFLPMRLSVKKREGDKAKKATKDGWPYDIMWSRLDRPEPELPEAEYYGTLKKHPEYDQAAPPAS